MFNIGIQSMLPILPILGRLTQTPTLPSARIIYRRNGFECVNRGIRTFVPIQEPVGGQTSAVFRRNSSYAVWDQRGLTLRSGSWSATMKLEEYPVSPRLFARDQILQNLSLFASGERKRQESALSGAVRVGSYVYFLPRWVDRDGKTWLEALVRVDLSSKKPAPQLMGRFEGYTMAYRPIDDELFALHGKICAITRVMNTWGLSGYDQSGFDDQPCGAELQSCMLARNYVLFVERTPYGSTVAGRLDLRTADRTTFLESSGAARFIDTSFPPVVVAGRNGKRLLISGLSGCETAIGDADNVRRSGPAVILFDSGTNPHRAELLDPERWSVLATWPGP